MVGKGGREDGREGGRGWGQDPQRMARRRELFSG